MCGLRATGLTLAVALLAACSSGGHDGSTSVFQHLSIADNGDVIAYARDGGNARIGAMGELAIAGKAVPVAPAQRELLQAYHADAVKLQKDGIATGAAGLSTGMHALGAVATGLASGKPDSIDAKVNAKADKVEALARVVCEDLARLYADQGKLAAAVPAFAPYATIESHNVSECHAD
ncbi:MAG TPA: hypothetical protein VF022_06665 [Rhodanobacteraceae bacterium]